MSLLLLFRPRDGVIVADPCVFDITPLADDTLSMSSLADDLLTLAVLADDTLTVAETECH